MEKEVLAERSPLFGRRTGQRRLEPLRPIETLDFFPNVERGGPGAGLRSARRDAGLSAALPGGPHAPGEHRRGDPPPGGLPLRRGAVPAPLRRHDAPHLQLDPRGRGEGSGGSATSPCTWASTPPRRASTCTCSASCGSWSARSPSPTRPAALPQGVSHLGSVPRLPLPPPPAEPLPRARRPRRARALGVRRAGPAALFDEARLDFVLDHLHRDAAELAGDEIVEVGRHDGEFVRAVGGPSASGPSPASWCRRGALHGDPRERARRPEVGLRRRARSSWCTASPRGPTGCSRWRSSPRGSSSDRPRRPG